MSDRIEASFDTLMKQATRTADSYLGDAVRDIDRRLGEGYAAANPNLVVAYMITASQDYTAASGAKVWQGMVDALCEAIAGRG